MIDKIQSVMKCIALAAAAALLIVLSYSVLQITAETQRTIAAAGVTVQALPEAVDGRLNQAIIELGAAARALDMQLTGFRGDLRKVADKLDAPLAGVTAGIEQVSLAGPGLQAVLANVAGITGQVNEAAPLFLDCDHNPDCVFNRFQGISKSIEKTSQDVSLMSSDIRQALPAALDNVFGIERSIRGSADTFDKGFPAIVSNVGGITMNVNRLTKPRWYDQALKFGVSGAAAYGALR